MSPPRWVSVQLPRDAWEELRDLVIKPAEREALRARSGYVELNWLRDAWRAAEFDGDLATIRLDRELLDVLAREVHVRGPRSLLDTVRDLESQL